MFQSHRSAQLHIEKGTLRQVESRRDVGRCRIRYGIVVVVGVPNYYLVAPKQHPVKISVFVGNMTAFVELSERVGIDAFFLQTYSATFGIFSCHGVVSLLLQAGNGTKKSSSPNDTTTTTTAASIRPRLLETKEMVVTVDSVLQLGGRRVGRLMLIPIPTQPIGATAAMMIMILFGSDHAGSTSKRFFRQMRPERFRCKC